MHITGQHSAVQHKASTRPVQHSTRLAQHSTKSDEWEEGLGDMGEGDGVCSKARTHRRRAGRPRRRASCVAACAFRSGAGLVGVQSPRHGLRPRSNPAAPWRSAVAAPLAACRRSPRSQPAQSLWPSGSSSPCPRLPSGDRPNTGQSLPPGGRRSGVLCTHTCKVQGFAPRQTCPSFQRT